MAGRDTGMATEAEAVVVVTPMEVRVGPQGGVPPCPDWEEAA